MKINNVIFWVSTAIISFMMLYNAYNYLTSEDMKGAFVRLGFPSYFRVELAVAKFSGALVLLIPGLPKTVKQFAYFGFALTFISAIVAHLSIGDGFGAIWMPAGFLVLLAVSYYCYLKINDLKPYENNTSGR